MPIASAHNLPPAIDRIEASNLLGVSMRTIDRYVKAGKLLAENSEGRVWLSRDQVYAMRQRRDNPPVPQFSPAQKGFSLARQHRAPSTFYKNTEDYAEQVPVHRIDENLAALKALQQKLEAAEHRIEQLKADRHIPHQQTPFDAETILAQREARDLKSSLAREQLNRRLITTLLYALILLQPVFWYVITR